MTFLKALLIELDLSYNKEPWTAQLKTFQYKQDKQFIEIIIQFYPVVWGFQQIERLSDGTFDDTIRLRKLWLQNNPLKTLEHFSFPALLHLKLLDLSSCQLSALGVKTLQRIIHLEVLNMQESFSIFWQGQS